jgi:hypothetical protein
MAGSAVTADPATAARGHQSSVEAAAAVPIASPASTSDG